MTTDVIFLVVLVACSLSINDASELDINKPYFESYDMSKSEKRSRSNQCELSCPCPRGPPSKPRKEYVIDDTLLRSQRNYVDWYKKRSEDASPVGVETVYSIWQQDGLKYPLSGPVYRKPFD